MNRIARNTLALYAAQFAVRLFNVAVVVLIGRRLGPADLGRYAFVLTIVTLVHQFAVAGLNNWLVREVARDESRCRTLLARSLAINVALSALGCAGVWMVSAVPAMSTDPLRGLCLRIFVASVFFSAMSETIYAVFDGHQDMRYRAGLVSVRAASRALLCVLLVAGLKSLPALFAGYLLVEAAVWATALTLAGHKFGWPRWAESLALDWSMIHEVWPFAALSVVLIAGARVPVWLLTGLRGNESAGLFSAAQGFIFAALLLPGAITNAAFPQLSQLAARAPAEFRALMARLLRWIAPAGLAAGVGVWVAAPLLVHALFGARYQASVGVLRILAWLLPTGFVNGALLTMLLAVNRQRAVLVCSVVVLTVSSAGGWWLIQRDDVIGAGWAALLADMLLLALYLVAARNAWAGHPGAA